MKYLYRSRKNRIIAGVCGGLGEYLGVDPVLIRIAWVIVSFFGGAGILAYVIAWIIIPDEKTKTSVLDDWRSGKRTSVTANAEEDRQVRYIFALFLIFIGVMFLLSNIGWSFWSWGYTWPAVLIVLGIIIILSRRRE